MAGHGRMKALARLLETGGVPEKSSEEVESEKIAIQNIHRQFYDADEANLLEEKDMHVFGCRPLTDPLRLVCCNACKKPIKASQYAAHAERCSSISSTADTALERDGDNGHKKPPRKGRRKLQAGKGKEHEKPTSKGEDTAAPSESNLNDHNSTPCSPSGEAQRILDTVDRAATRNASGICNGGKNCSSGVPSPLATKIYYSQGSHRLRIALGHLYHKMSPKEHGHDSVCVEVKEDSKALHETHKDGVTQMKVDRQSAFQNNSKRMAM